MIAELRARLKPNRPSRIPLYATFLEIRFESPRTPDGSAPETNLKHVRIADASNIEKNALQYAATSAISYCLKTALKGAITMTVFLTIFVTVFLAELGDKTQLATILFAADAEHNRAFVFLAATLALTASTGLAVVLGMAAGKWLTVVPLDLIAGLGFIAIGLWTLYGHFSG